MYGIELRFTDGTLYNEINSTKISQERVPWRQLCVLEPGERIVDFGLKTFEPSPDISHIQNYSGVRIEVKQAVADGGEVRVIEEDWRAFGTWAKQGPLVADPGYRIIGIHGYTQLDLHITHLGFILLAD